jgi:hypothetical protein
MPYYLVTQTSLVEDEDEVKAAEKVLAKLHSDGSVEFTVKFDEENIRHVTVANLIASEIVRPIVDSSPPFLGAMPENVVHDMPDVTPVTTGEPKEWRLMPKSLSLALCLFAAGLFIGLVVGLVT